MERELALEVSAVLPGVEADDGCLDRLEQVLRGNRALRRAHLDREVRPARLCLHYDPDILSLAEVKRLAERTGSQILGRYQHDLLTITGMDCSDCAVVIEHSVGRVDGVLAVRVNYAAQTVRIEFDARHTGRSAIERHLRTLGYTVPAGPVRGWVRANRELLFNLTAGLLLALAWVGARYFGLSAWAALALYAGAYAFGGFDVARHAWGTLRERQFNTDVLMITAALGAAALGELADGAFLLFLFGLGHVLEERALDRARAAIRALASLTPKTALVRRDGGERDVPVEALQLGDVVIARPGARIPVDGVVASGASAVNQAPVTGESLPVDKAPGDKVFAGSVNGEGALEVRVTRLARDSTLARVARMVEEAQTQKSPTQQAVERFERVFVPSVLVATALIIVLPPLFGWPWRDAFLRAMTLLVAASPCALALGTPAAVLAGVAQAARHGVLIKGGVHLENLGRLRALAFDKTGTLTYGRPEVTDVLPVVSTEPAGGESADALLALAGAVESRSGHPLAQAVVRAARVKGLSAEAVGAVESLTGRGLRAEVNGQPVLIGTVRLMEESGVAMPAGAQEQVDALQAQGKTTMLVVVAGRVRGVIALADTLRPEVPATMAALRALGVGEIVMLTGDHTRVAEAVARQAGVTRVAAELMPEDKLAAIRELGERFGVVAMVGDGVNDAPALANATVGIAMGGAGTDVALETADVALMADDLAKLPFAVSLGRATRAVIQQNLALALGVIALLVVTSLAGVTGIGVAVVLHEGSTLAVVGNALRLLAHRP
jgi:Cd2+/Zn2+-exporting ATPase